MSDFLAPIDLKHYKIYFQDDFSSLLKWVGEHRVSSILILVDENTKEKCLPLFLSVSKLQSLTIPIIVKCIKVGESQKTILTIQNIMDTLIESYADRNTLIINLGGGMIGDIGGFVASIYKRGVDFIQIPTSLLAMVDASVGGKTGINYKEIKNVLGSFYHPKQVFIFPEFLNSLPKKEKLSGFAEMLKHAVIANKNLFFLLEKMNIDSPIPLDYIKQSIEIKRNIVLNDMTENNIRKILNFGHTIGHAIESYSLYHTDKPLTHGQAVASGMYYEILIAIKLDILLKRQGKQILSVIKHFFDIFPLAKRENKVLSNTLNDKKNTGKKLMLSLPTTLGSCRYDVNLNYDKMLEILCD